MFVSLKKVRGFLRREADLVDNWARLGNLVRGESTGNGNPAINVDFTGAVFTLNLCQLILKDQCKEGAIDVNVH